MLALLFGTTLTFHIPLAVLRRDWVGNAGPEVSSDLRHWQLKPVGAVLALQPFQCRVLPAQPVQRGQVLHVQGETSLLGFQALAPPLS